MNYSENNHAGGVHSNFERKILNEGEGEERTVLEPMSMAALEDNVDPDMGQMAAAAEEPAPSGQPASGGDSVIPENILAQIPEEDWYIVLDGAQAGPISRGTLLRHIADGQADGNAYVWREGFAEWLVMNDVPGLRDVIAADGNWGTQASEADESLPTLDDLKKTQLVSSDVLEAASAHVAAARAEREAAEEVSAQANMDSIFGDESTEDSGGGFFDVPEADSAKEAEDLLYQRRDTSVLFSMDDLSGGARSAPGIGEGLGERTQESGLIDIRAVARNRVTTTEESSATDLFSELEGGMETKVMTSAMDTRMRQGTAPLLRVKKKSSAWPLVAGVGIGSLIAALAFVAVIGNPFSSSEETASTSSSNHEQNGSASQNNGANSVPVNEPASFGSENDAPAGNDDGQDAAYGSAAAVAEEAPSGIPANPAEVAVASGAGEQLEPQENPGTVEEPPAGEAVAGTTEVAAPPSDQPAVESPKAVETVSKAAPKASKKQSKKTTKKTKKEKKPAKQVSKVTPKKEVAPPPVPEPPKKKVVSSGDNERRSDATALLASLKSDGGGSGGGTKAPATAKAESKPKTLSSSAIRKVIRKYQKKVKKCYLNAASDPQDKVVVTAKMVVSGSGGVNSVSITGNAPASAKSCIEGVLKSVKFPSFGGDSQTVKIPFRLK